MPTHVVLREEETTAWLEENLIDRDEVEKVVRDAAPERQQPDLRPLLRDLYNWGRQRLEQDKTERCEVSTDSRELLMRAYEVLVATKKSGTA
jgi:hypothetical protein